MLRTVSVGTLAVGVLVACIEEGLPQTEVRLATGAVLILPDGIELGGPARIFANHETYAALDVSDPSRLHFFGASGEFQTTVGPFESATGGPAPLSTVLFHEDGPIRILSGRGQRAFLASRGFDEFVGMPFLLPSIWDAVPASENELVVNAPSMEPGAVGQPLHRVTEAGEILHSFGRGAADLFVPDVNRLRWPVSDEVVNGTVWIVDPMDLSARRFSLSGESVGDSRAAPDALLGLLPQGNDRSNLGPITPLKSWEETPGRIWNLTWVPQSHMEDLRIKPMPCPLPNGHTVVELGARAPTVTLIDVRDLADGSSPQIAAVDCRLMGILAGGRVYMTTNNKASGTQAVHVFTLEVSSSHTGIDRP